MHEREPPLPCSPEVRSESWNRGLASVLAIETRFSIIGYWRPGIAGCRREPKRPLARRPLLVTGRGGDIGNLRMLVVGPECEARFGGSWVRCAKEMGGRGRDRREQTNRDPLALLTDTIGTCSRNVPFLAEEMRGGSEFPRKCLRGEGNKLFVFFARVETEKNLPAPFSHVRRSSAPASGKGNIRSCRPSNAQTEETFGFMTLSITAQLS